MNKISDLTYKVVAFFEIKNYNTDECVDWAIEMISLGHETPSLFILAGLQKPTNYFETIEYLKTALLELNFPIKAGNEAILSYYSYYISKLSQSEHIKENLKLLYEFYISQPNDKFIFDFCLLHWTWDDFENNIEPSYYWENANKNNIEEIVVETSNKWITKYRNQYMLKA